jgi:hypothetical protein
MTSEDNIKGLVSLKFLRQCLRPTASTIGEDYIKGQVLISKYRQKKAKIMKYYSKWGVVVDTVLPSMWIISGDGCLSLR